MQKELSDATDDCMIVEFEPETLKVVREAVYNVADLDVPTRDLADKLDMSDYNPLSMVIISPSYVPIGLLVKPDCKTRLLAVRGKHRHRLERALFHALSVFSTDALDVNEARERFLGKVWTMIDYWETVDPEQKSLRERLSGLAFSILSTIDGAAVDHPAMHLIPMSTEEDNEFRRRVCERPYRSTEEFDFQDYDIAGSLHDIFHEVEEHYLPKTDKKVLDYHPESQPEIEENHREP